MPSINMIAARRADKRRLEQNKRKLFYVILGEIGLVIALLSGMAVKLVTTGFQSSELSDQLQKLKGKVAEIQQLESLTAALQPKVTALNEATSNTLYWYTALQNVTDSLPTDAWLTTLQTAGDASAQAAAAGSPATAGASGGGRLTLAGEATNQFDVGTAMLRLNCYPDVSVVKLHQVTQDPNKGDTANFDLEVQLKPQAPLAAVPGDQNVQKS